MAFSRFKKFDSASQRKEAAKLCELAGIDSDQPCGLDEVRKLQDALPNYILCVYTDKKGRECVFKGDYTAGCKNIYLLMHNAHFSAILYPRRAFEFERECYQCPAFFNNKQLHTCEGSCWRCFGPSHTGPAQPLRRCTDCCHQFSGDGCFNTHQTVKLVGTPYTKCQSFHFCVRCEKSYS